MPFHALKNGTVTDKNRKRSPFCHSDRSASGVEESTTLENEPTQDNTCHLGRFLNSHSLPRNDMPLGGSGCSRGLYLGRSRNGTQAVPNVFAGGFYFCALCCYNNKCRSAPILADTLCLSLWERWPSAARTERGNVEDLGGRDYSTNAAGPSQSPTVTALPEGEPRLHFR